MFISKLFSAKLQFMRKPIIKSLATGLYSGLLTLCIIHSAFAVPTQDPLFLSNPVVPLAMLNMSKDHQLYVKLYDDYSDITDTRATVDGNANPNYGKFAQDGDLDLTYVNIYDYYGYFDSGKCYSYSAANKRFEPVALVNTSKYCDGTTWSGNFLNWATMTRMDAVRKILFGGYRSKDDTETVLERVLLPHDAHAFAKHYNKSDLSQLIPTTVIGGADLGLADTFKETGITFCNTTKASSGMSQTISSATNPPLLRIAKGNFSLWASNERWQCTWNEEHSASNSNNPTASGIYAFNTNPKKTGLTTGNSAGGFDARGDSDGNGVVDGDYIVRVQVCKNTTLKESNCYAYPNGNLKPRGLLHKYGENYDDKKAKILFGLMTGSYSKNKQGGVLRKNISNLSDEVDSNSGIFSAISVPSGIIATLSMMRIRGYSYSDGTYLGAKSSGGDDCPWQKNGFVDTQCTNWGNPQSELYLQALRYFAGKFGATSDPFDTTDNTTNTGIDKLPKIEPNKGASANTSDKTTWMDPLTTSNYCSPLNVIQFNATVSSYDNDDISAFKDQISGGTELSTIVDMIGNSTHENLYTGKFFVGHEKTATPTTKIDLCTAKALTGLSLVTGTCPDAPHLRGSYNIAGLASYARENDLRSDLKDKQVVRTYGVELAPAIPSVTLQIPGSTTKTVKILPACANHGTGSGATGNCGLVAFKVVSQTSTSTEKTGTLYVNWEESEQGGDFDQDMWGVIKYTLTSSNLKITTKVLAKSTSSKVGFGYILSGTSTGDGFHVWSGANGFTYPDTSIVEESGITTAECNNCDVANAAVSKDYSVGDASADSFLGSPLYYAAKWGGYSADFESAAQDDAAKKAETYDVAYLHKLVKTRSTSDSYFFATDPLKLEDSLDKTFSNVANDTGSAASVATNSARLAEDNYIFQAQFRSGTWDGTIKGYEFDAKGNITTTNPLVSNVPTTRKIYIKKGTGLADFNWSNLADLSLSSQFILSPETNDVIAKKRISWLTGSETDEFSITNNTGMFRSRTFTVADGSSTTQVRNVIGDIVNSSPAYVGGFNYRYNSLTEGGSTYAKYVADKQNKDPMIYIGANDGMMHAFNAKTLTEKFAYVVTATLPKMAKLAELDYGKNLNKHQYLVDGPVVTGDAYFETDEKWHSVVVGTLGAGGKGIYALDVTDAANPKLLWELTDADISGLGYVMSKPFIVPLTNGRWGVILGNGDSSTSPLSKLIVIDLLDPLTKTTTINTTKGTGLSAPAVLVNAKGEATTVYAGDTKGNLFKFDLKDTSAINWTSSLIFIAKDSANNLQPITAAPTIGINNQLGGKYMVYFGTGKYFDDGDNTTPSSPEYSFYAIPDMGTLISRTNLLGKTISYDIVSKTRSVSTTNPNWTSEYGWYLDFTDTNGERVTTKALLIQDKLIFPTLIPSSISCQYGGSSWLMEVTAVGDKFIGTHLLEDIVKSEFLILGDLGFGVVTEGTGAVLASTSKATLLNKSVSLTAGDFSRQSWRQLK